jgi:hypothetical protein
MADPQNLARIKAGAGKYWGTTQDYSKLSPFVTHDPNFAGTAKNGEPLFMDENGDVYTRIPTGPGKEIRMYASKFPPGSKEAISGVPVEDELKAQASRDAQARLLSVIQAQDAIDDYNQKLAAFQKGGGQINDWQRGALAAIENTGTGPIENWNRWWATHAGGLNQEIIDLDLARQTAANLATQSITKTVPESQKLASTLQLPSVTDNLANQKLKMDQAQRTMLREIQTLSQMYPYANQGLRDLEARILKAHGVQPDPNKSVFSGATPSPTATPGATPRKPTYQEAQAAPQINSPEDVKRYSSGTLVRDMDGKLKYVP